MPVKREGQLEKCVDEAIRKHDFHALQQFLETDFPDDISHKCSKQFLNKLDKLICQQLDSEEVNNVSTLLNILQNHGRNINILGEVGFPAMIEYGLIQKMVNWFEKAKEILKNKDCECNEAFTTLFEDFFDVLMIVHDTSSEGKIQTLENFILRISALAADKRISIYIQQEAVRKLNTMLTAMPRDIRKKTISTKEMLRVMNDMGKRILDAGDYDLQVAITEALCRMTSEKQRRELAIQWFPMDFVSSAFKQIKDSEFETDCRKFLNQVNGMLGDKRRVFTYPCLSAALDKHELQMPADENLEECWIDFNVGSKSISFYVAADDEGQQWETVCIPEEDVKTYLIEEKEKEKLLMVHLNNSMSVGAQEGEKIILHFDSALEIMDAIRKVYDATKCQGFTRKNTGSVAKTMVHVVFDESGSQVLVPESQTSPLKEKECKSQEEKNNFCSKHLSQCPQAEINPSKKTIEMDFQTGQTKTTPGKRKMSEASMILSSTSRFSVQSPFSLINTSTPRKGKIKTPLQMTSLVERNDVFSVPETRAMKAAREANCAPLLSATKALNRNNSIEKEVPAEKMKNMIHSEEDVDINGKQKLDELSDIVPDSQPPICKSDKSLLPGLSDNYIAEIKTQKKTKCWIPETIITQCQKITASESIVYQAANLSDRAAKQKAFASIFEMTSSELRHKQRFSGELIEAQHSKTNKMPDSQTNFKHLDEKRPKSKSRKSVSNTSEISLPATKKNNSSLINSRHSKSISEMNDHDTRLNVSPPETANKKTDPINYEKKAKSKDVIEAAEMLISKISKRYKEKNGVKNTGKPCQSFSDSRTSLNKIDSDSKKKRQNRKTGNFRTTVHNNTNEHVDDVYDFNLSGFDEPTIKLGVQELHLSLEATRELPKKMTQKNETKSKTQKKQEGKGKTNRNYKHLFSDTDTEYRGDDTKTDISWLRESNRKPKPQLINYTRARKPRKSKTLEPDKFSVSPEIREISPPPKNRSNKNDNDDGERILPTRSKKLRKAAQAKKYYKELSSSEIESEEEISEYLNKKNTSNEYPEHKITAKSRAVNQSEIQQHTLASETVKGKLINQPKRPTKEKDDMIKKQMELPSSPSSGSPPFSEIMRCYEKHREESTEEHISMRRSSLSSYLEELTPDKEKSLENIKENSTMGKINSENKLLKGVSEKGRKLVFETEDLSPVISPLSLSNLSPFNRKKTFINYKNSEIAKDKICEADEAVIITTGYLDKSFHTEIEDTSENIMNSRGEASLPPSQLTTPCRSRERLQHEECLTDVHKSGPTMHSNFKRMYQEDTENYSDDEEEIRREERKIKLLPRKLFKADDSTYKVSESLSTFSVNETSLFDGEGWDTDCSNVEMICQKLHKEFARKIQNRSKKIDCFAKQSLQTANQHMYTMGRDVYKHRTRQLEKLHSCLLKELESFERDSQILRTMEKDFSNFSKKHFETFSTYNKNEQQRFQNLRTSFEKNVFHTADEEENIFLSQVHLLKEDIKGIQDKFLKEMHEEELLNVRKGLQSLFMAEGRKL